MCGPVVRVSISNGLILPTSMDDLDTMILNSFSNNEESLSLASCGICAYCRIIDCFELFCSGWKFDSSCTVGSFCWTIEASEFSVLVHEMLLSSISLISIACNVPIMVVLGM